MPDGVEVYPRYGANGAVYILVNFAKTPQTVKLPAAMHDVLNGGLRNRSRCRITAWRCWREIKPVARERNVYAAEKYFRRCQSRR